MAKRKVSLALSILLIVSGLLGNVCFAGAAEVLYSGAGTAEDPYIISSAEDFLAIPDGANAVYKITADITLPAGYQPKTFAGTLTAGAAADAKTITVSIQGESENTYENGYGTGLFSTLFGTAKLEFLKLSGTVSGTNLVGGFAGLMLDSAVVNGCTNTATINGNGFNVGGIAGAVRNTTAANAINNCHNRGSVTDESTNGSWTGGLAGHTTQNVYGSSNTATITGNTSVGGLMGALYSNSTTAVKRSYNAGRVIGSNSVGGIAGATRYTAGTIVSCYNSGRIIATGVEADGSYAESAKIYCGGITSGGISNVANTGVTIKDCYNAGEVIGGKDVNNLYSFAGCGGTAGVEATGNAKVTNCYVLNHSDSFYPTYKQSTTYIKLKTQYQLKAADMISSSTLPSGDFQTGVASVYPYPRIKANLQDVAYVAPVLTVQLAEVKATGGDKSVVISWTDAANVNHDMVEISDGTRVIARVSASEKQYTVSGLNPSTDYTFKVTAMKDYKAAITADRNYIAYIEVAVTTLAGDAEVSTYSKYYNNGISQAFVADSMKDNGSVIKEFGMVYSLSSNAKIGDANAVKLVSDAVLENLNEAGQFGIEIKAKNGLLVNDYYIKAYVIYEKDGESYTAYGKEIFVDIR